MTPPAAPGRVVAEVIALFVTPTARDDPAPMYREDREPALDEDARGLHSGGLAARARDDGRRGHAVVLCRYARWRHALEQYRALHRCAVKFLPHVSHVSPSPMVRSSPTDSMTPLSISHRISACARRARATGSGTSPCRWRLRLLSAAVMLRPWSISSSEYPKRNRRI